MTKITKFLLLLTFLTSWNSSFAQKDAFAQNDELLSLTKQLNPVEPSVAGIARYGVYPVNYSTGLPLIEIPIHTLRAGDIEIPIKLSYRGGGIPVAEESTWVGLGWDLFYGGSITRQVNGRPDDPNEMKEAPTSSDVTKNMDNNPVLTNPYPLQLYEESGGNSNRRDVFYFNVNGSNGSFVYDSNGRPLQIPYGSYSVTCPSYGFNNPDFLIKSSDGISYSFSSSDITELLPVHSTFPKFTSAWHLDKVLSANKCDSIYYTYQNGGNLTESTFSCSEGYRVTSIDTLPNKKVEENLGLKVARHCQNVTTSKPSCIITPNEMVEFVLDDRSDIYYVPTNFSTTSKPKKLRAIIVKEKINGEYKQKKMYNFFYSYFTSGNGNTTLDLKLKLDSVTLVTKEGKQLVAAFDYYGDDFCPSKNSYSADYWGFYNGARNTTPIPRTANPISKYQKLLGGANLSADEENTKVGSLKSIIYPTGGSTTFDWEANRSDTFVGDAMEMKTVSVYTCNSPLLLCSNKPSPDPSVEIDYGCEGPSVPFKCNKSESVEVSYRLGKTDTEDFQHNKYDRGTILMTESCPDGRRTLIEHNLLNGIQHSEVIALNEGCEYTLWAFNNCKNISGGIGLTYNSYNPNGTQNQKNYVSGGLRVKSIENFDCNHQLLTKKRFTYLVPNTRYSSGKLQNTQQKHYTALHETIQPIGVSTNHSFGILKHIKEFYVYSRPTSGAYSNSVNYQYVQVYDVDSQNHDIGYTEYEFATCEDEHVSDSAPDISMGWNRGQTLKETAYRLEFGTPIKVQEMENYYSVDKRINRSVRCLDVSKGMDILQNGAGEEKFTISNVYRVLNYFYEQNWKHLDSTVTTNFFGNNKLVTKTAYAYENYKYTFPSRTTTTTSHNACNECITKYPQDYIDGLAHLNVGNDAIITVAEAMVWRNMIKPIEVLKKANGRLVNADLYWYESSSKFGPQVKKKFSLITSSTPIMTEKDIVYPSNPKFEIKYNSTTGRIEETKNQNGVVNTFLWGYNNQHPVASVLNASLPRIAYDNFEGISNATSSSFLGNSWSCSQCLVNVSGSHTGINCIEPQNASVKTINTIPSGTYRISFWAKQKEGTSGGTVAINASSKFFSVDNDWKYNEDTINLNSDQQVLITTKNGVLLDDIRLHPVDAQMTTYTWNNNNGITSAIDSKGLSTLYEYDEFGRLQLQKDLHLKIQQHYDYQYGFAVLDPKGTSLSFSGSGGTQGMPITSNTTWSTSSNCSWLTATPSENEGSSTLNISCSANLGGPRTGTITLKTTSYGSITRTITVSQASIPSYLNVGKANFFFEYLGGNQSITVSSSHPWSVSTIKGAFIMATKVDEQTLRINCSEYSGGPIYRNGSVTISNGNQNVIIKICQGTDPTKYPQRD